MNKDLVSIKDLSAKDINGIFSLASEMKKRPFAFSRALRGKTLALIFEKPSNRTYVSFQVGMYQLGGDSIYLGPEHIKLGVRESVHDVAKTLSRYVDGIVIRTFAHAKVLEMARYSNKPVINGLSDFSHPCQALADVLTIKEKLRRLKGVTLAYVGDGNNVCVSLLYICSKLGIHMKVATPLGYAPGQKVIMQAKALAHASGARILISHNAPEAAKGADVLYTDVWASMGQEKEAERRKRIFRAFQLNSKLASFAKKKALIMHCLPAHRGEEITDEIIDSKNSIVFDQAENRMHVQKAILIKLMKGYVYVKKD
ncbi:MAG: ornithine carbamoyltransferase [Candidatus Omnitrophota bacterium]|nr:MAG: ornithine carbamoyltransferase [Candidatus Omnitrophota bacterium]